MVMLAAWWGLGYAALLVSTVVFGWHTVIKTKLSGEAQPIGLTGRILVAISTLLLWAGLLGRALKGRGWPFASPADTAAGIALLMLSLHLVGDLLVWKSDAGLAVTTIALMLLSYGVGQQTSSLKILPVTSTGVLVSDTLNLCGGSLLALAAALSLTGQVFAQQAGPKQASDRWSETLVRGALCCLAISLAVDTWWLQKVGLGNENDAHQAGIAIAWMIYFVALRLRANPRWRGWPWTAILAIGFACTLPILLNVSWLENTLPI